MSIFRSIIERKIPASIVYESERIIAFRDINPLAPVHILIVPKKEIPDLNFLIEEEKSLYGEILLSISKVAEIEGIKESGYRVISNTGKDAHQEVKHLHFHLLGGTDLGELPII